MRSTLQVLLISSVLSLLMTACGGSKNEKFDYRDPSAINRGSGLEVPPDLITPARDDRYVVPKANTASAAAAATVSGTQVPEKAVVDTSGRLRLERFGNQRWIVARISEDTVWSQLRSFWKDMGFILVKDDLQVGVMETDWAENRANIGRGDPVRRILGSILGPVVSNGERDRYRTRIERTSEPGVIEIYVSHRAAEEMGGASITDKSYWELRPSNPELEAEMLQRLMIRLGANEKQAQQMVVDSKVQVPERAKVVTVSGQQQLQLELALDPAWRQIGLALDRIGVVVEDRDRAKGQYFVRYIAADDTSTQKEREGWFARMFSWGSKKEAATNQFRVEAVADGQQTVVRLLSKDGTAAPAVSAKQILNLLYNEMK